MAVHCSQPSGNSKRQTNFDKIIRMKKDLSKIFLIKVNFKLSPLQKIYITTYCSSPEESSFNIFSPIITPDDIICIFSGSKIRCESKI